ncbi:cysteine-rich CWC family protein [Lysinibacillus sp. NPDC097287]|uniref:cysteine-rich CWC family protein n=1 Tax=Lysinibacillus sp. NPDC097287 TaxID=3364144 RepID=UPI00382F9D94
MSKLQVDEKHCPLCGGDNHCKVGTDQQMACWCVTAKFPNGILGTVPVESQGKHCICQNCIDTYKCE